MPPICQIRHLALFLVFTYIPHPYATFTQISELFFCFGKEIDVPILPLLTKEDQGQGKVILFN
jgi:hypothetical protein